MKKPKAKAEKRKPTYHKMEWATREPFSMVALCDYGGTFTYLARDWKDVTCSRCLASARKGSK